MLHRVRVALALTTVAMLDAGLCAALRRCPRFDDRARWFLLHSLVNVLIAGLCLPGARAFLTRPHEALVLAAESDALLSPASPWPLTLAVALHAHHCIGGFALSRADWFHHVVFIPTLGVPGMLFDWGCVHNWLALFVCGVPGAVDYLLLGCQRMDRMTRWDQKRIAANLNVWLRAPGVLVAVGVSYSSYMRGDCRAPTPALLAQFVFMTANVLFYAKQSVVNFVLHRVRRHVPTQDWTVLKAMQDGL